MIIPCWAALFLKPCAYGALGSKLGGMHAWELIFFLRFSWINVNLGVFEALSLLYSTGIAVGTACTMIQVVLTEHFCSKGPANAVAIVHGGLILDLMALFLFRQPRRGLALTPAQPINYRGNQTHWRR